MTRSMRAIALLALLGGLALPSGLRAADAPSGTCPARGKVRDTATPIERVTVTGIMHDGGERRGSRLDGAATADLRILVAWRHLDRPHTARIALIAPDGNLYQTFTSLVTPPGRGFRRTTSETRVPIAGSWITTHGLYGRWCVEVHVDDDPEAAARQSFVLTPPR
jgi:hypothetical protein